MDYTITNSSNTNYTNSNIEYHPMYNVTNGRVGLVTSSPNEKLHINNTIISQPMNNQNQIKVAIFRIEKVEDQIISSEMIHEGWLDRTNKEGYMSIDLQAAKEFNISYDDLDKIVVKEILGVNF